MVNHSLYNLLHSDGSSVKVKSEATCVDMKNE